KTVDNWCRALPERLSRLTVFLERVRSRATGQEISFARTVDIMMGTVHRLIRESFEARDAGDQFAWIESARCFFRLAESQASFFARLRGVRDLRVLADLAFVESELGRLGGEAAEMEVLLGNSLAKGAA